MFITTACISSLRKKLRNMIVENLKKEVHRI